jgi:hypothetical protein
MKKKTNPTKGRPARGKRAPIDFFHVSDRSGGKKPRLSAQVVKRLERIMAELNPQAATPQTCSTAACNQFAVDLQEKWKSAVPGLGCAAKCIWWWSKEDKKWVRACWYSCTGGGIFVEGARYV